MPPQPAPRSIRTGYCQRLHRLKDGAPVAHPCRVLPVEALKAEASGDRLGAVRMLAAHAAGGPLQEHGGVWNVRRR
jgi:hypothetical protein